MTCDMMRKHGGVFLTCDIMPPDHPGEAHHDPEGIWWHTSPMVPDKDWAWVRDAYGSRPLDPDKALAVIMDVVGMWVESHGDLADHNLADLMNHLDWLNHQLTRGRDLPRPWRDGQEILAQAQRDMDVYKYPPHHIVTRYLDAAWMRAYGKKYPGSEQARRDIEEAEGVVIDE